MKFQDDNQALGLTPQVVVKPGDSFLEQELLSPRLTDETFARNARASSYDQSQYNFDDIRARLLQGARVTSLMTSFERIASGQAQVPSAPVEASQEFLLQDPERLTYHRIFQRNLGPFLHHGCASIPYLMEEVIRVGLALSRLSHLYHSCDNPFHYYETSSADGTVARALAEYAGGRIRTLTDSPNASNELEFYRLCQHPFSFFYRGCFADVTPELIQAAYPCFSQGFDLIWENTTFQFYGQNRAEQIAYVKRLLKEDGIMLFLEKMIHRDRKEYFRYEQLKDDKFKSRYFSAEQISAKREEIVNAMEQGQTTLHEFIDAARGHFKNVYVIWNSSNFYQIVASNSEEKLRRVLSNLSKIFVPKGFLTGEVHFTNPGN